MCIKKKINKTALSSDDDDKRLQISYKIITYLHGKNAFKVCESEIMKKIAIFAVLR